jgi:hypothetical protein
MLALPLPERVALGKQLREAGFRVAEQPMERLAAAWRPPSSDGPDRPATADARACWAVVVDIHAPGADRLLQALRRADADETDGSDESGVPTRRSSPWLGPLVVAVGVADPDDIELRSPDGAFERPLDLGAVVEFLSQAAFGGESFTDDPADAEEPRSMRAPGYDASLADDFPAIAGLPGAEAMLPDSSLSGDLADSSGSRLSDDIEALLESSALRAKNARSAANGKSADEAPVLVSQDVLTTLDDLLLGEDDVSGAGGAISQLAAPPSSHESSAAGSQTGALATAARSAPAWRSPPGSGDGRETGAALPSEPAPTHEGAPTGKGARDTSVPPAADSRSSRGNMVPTEQRDASSFPPAAPSPLPLHESLPIPSPTIGTVSARSPEGKTISEPPFADTGFPPSQPPFAPAGPFGAPWTASPGQLAGATSARLPSSAGPSDAPKTHADSWYQGGAATAPPPYAMPSVPPTQWDRPSSMPPPRTWAGMPGAAAPDRAAVAPSTDPLMLLARAIASRSTGALTLTAKEERVRWVLLQDGDVVTATSQLPEEGLLPFLIERGALSAEVAELYAHRLPHSGRHAAAALIANGFLGQDELWPVLRAHAEWLITRALEDGPAQGRVIDEPPERLQAEPNVFGGAAGVEVFVEIVRRVVPADDAIRRMGGRHARLSAGPCAPLLAESALTAAQAEAVRGAVGSTVGDVLARQGDPFAPILFALLALQVLGSPTASAPAPEQAADDADRFDPLDAQAVRERVRARMALVREADYFSLLGLTPSATDYEIRRAFVQLRSTFEPSKLLTAATADLADDVRLIVEVLEEAYQILRDPQRRKRYRNAILETAR